MTAVDAEIVIDQQPGVYDIPADEYHRGPIAAWSLSSTGARTLLDCPARYRWQQDNPPAVSAAFDLGHAAHRLVLGVGPELVRIKAAEWRSNETKAEVKAVREAGNVPLHHGEHDQVTAMAAQIRAHPLAAALLNPELGHAERTLLWQDEQSGVWCRCMADWLRGDDLIVDYKTTESASPDAFSRTVAKYQYETQAGWYRDGHAALFGRPARFVFLVQEKSAPYLVNTIQLDDEALGIGEAKAARAREIYRDCTAAGIWPGYPIDIPTISLPRYAVRQHEETQL